MQQSIGRRGSIRRRGSRLAVASVALLALVAAACGGDDTAGDGAASSASSEATGGGETTASSDYENRDEGVTTDSIAWGLIYDQTGPTAGTQQPFADGINTALGVVNDEGGVHGRTIDVAEEDEKYEVPTGVAAYNKLVNNTPVLGMTALNNSSLQAAVIEDVDANGVPILGAQSTTKIAVNPTREYFWAMQCSWADQADVAVAHAFQELGQAHDAVAVFGNVASGEEYGQQIQDRVEAGGGTYLGGLTIEFGAPEADAQVQEIASLEPDVIHLHGTTTNGIPLVRSMEKFGMTDTLVVGAYGLHVPEIARSAPAVADSYDAVDCYAFEGEASEDVAAAAKAAGFDEELYTRREFVNGWVVGNTIAAALEVAGPELTRQSLNEAIPTITDMDTGGLSPNVSFGPDDHVGIDAVKPFSFSTEADDFESIGTYEDYADCIVNEDLTESLDKYDPLGCASGG